MNPVKVVMTWLRWRYRNGGRSGAEAAQRATEGLQREVDRWPKIVEITGSTPRRLHRNNFGESMMELFQNGARHGPS